MKTIPSPLNPIEKRIARCEMDAPALLQSSYKNKTIPEISVAVFMFLPNVSNCKRSEAKAKALN